MRLLSIAQVTHVAEEFTPSEADILGGTSPTSISRSFAVNFLRVKGALASRSPKV